MDCCFSPNYEFVLTASTSGSVRLWQTMASDPSILGMPNVSLTCAAFFRPFDGAPVSSAFFVGKNVDGFWPISCGNATNSVIQLWKPSGVSTWSKSHELALAQPDLGSWTNAYPDASLQFVVFANINESSVLVVALAEDSTSFNEVSKWDINFPILSFVSASVGTTENSQVALYCVQTMAIQRYTINTIDCKSANSGGGANIISGGGGPSPVSAISAPM
jgi:hypothetical protein